MVVMLSTRADFTLGNYAQVAWRRAGVTVAGEALARIETSRAAFLALLDRDPPPVIYGVTTGYGQRASRRLAGDERRAHAARPPLSSVAAFGTPVPDRVSRGIVFCRLANFIEGHAAVSGALATAVARLLDGAALPPLSAEGQGGAGEIMALAPLMVGAIGDRALGEKEALALINGSPAATALVADTVLAMRRRLELAEQLFALSVEAFDAPLDAYDPAFAELWGDPHEAAALASLGRWLAGAGGARRPYQAPVSYRILPRLLGQFHRALATAEDVAATALSAVTDNPVFLPADAA